MKSAPRLDIIIVAFTLSILLLANRTTEAQVASEVFETAKTKVVKIYGAGGLRGLEDYQTGFFISADGYILTVWSTVLDTNYIRVTLDDGSKFAEAKLVAADPYLSIAVLKVDVEDHAFFDLKKAKTVLPGGRVLALSNLYGVATGNEAVSLQHGVVSARTKLDARKGGYKTPYNGDVLIIDAMTNNPGAAGGVVTDRSGNLVGLIGKELKSATQHIWLNYTIPIEELSGPIADMIAGKHQPSKDDLARPTAEQPVHLNDLGLVMVPDILERTPPFVDEVRIGSPANLTGLQPDDLVFFVNGKLIQTLRLLKKELTYIDQAETVEITVMRDQELITVELLATPENE